MTQLMAQILDTAYASQRIAFATKQIAVIGFWISKTIRSYLCGHSTG